ncbi:hypothetical protein [Streptomyces sp. TRM64462]|uniref:hypothetical protein n=1 Tax=Streptomyces sp. TRM64462 TaxID=2741726 RepID=UPI001586B72F|nr:hypothetical protein [Streptomyces sp. TRM64462]
MSAAAADGWTGSGVPDHFGRLCFARNEGGGGLMLVVFDTVHGPVSDYNVGVSATADGADVVC